MNIRTPDSPPYAEYRRRGTSTVSVFLPVELVEAVASLVGRIPRVVADKKVPARIAYVLVEYCRRYPDGVTHQPAAKRQTDVPHAGRQLSLHIHPEDAKIVADALTIQDRQLYEEWESDESSREARKPSRRGLVIAACQEALATGCWGLDGYRHHSHPTVVERERAGRGEVTHA